MRAQDYEAQVETTGINDIVLTTSKKVLSLRIVGDDGKWLSAYLADHDVADLIVALTIWQQHKAEGFD
jgi:hypothetical protein